jgi:23S rRNA (uracil1939-C5)-methyltransferase
MVVDALVRVGGFVCPPVSPVLPSALEYGYRNHARFTVGPGGALGFVNRETGRFIKVDHCMLMHDGISSLLAQLQGKCAETTQLSIRAGQETGSYLVQPSLAALGVEPPTGQKSYVDHLDGRPFKVSSPSFFQVNTVLAARAVQVVRHGLGLKAGDVLLDAYTGVGTFATLLAPHAGKVIAVEESSAAVADARENAAGLHNVEFVLGKTEDMLAGLGQRPDAVVLDPPRSGCRPEALRSLMELEPPRVAYVSCDPETLARDLKLLCQGPYDLQLVVPLDMFPQTHHVECVALLALRPEEGLARNGNPSPVVLLASASLRRRELLAELGLRFVAVPSDIAEEPLAGEPPQDLVRRLSLAKASAVAGPMASGYIVAADSVVVLGGRAMGKPADAAEARRMLRELRGTQHQVMTGVTVIDAASGRCLTESMTSEIRLRSFSDAEIEESVASGTPLDKAGAYAVQDQGLRPAESWQGCYSNIVGLPLCRLVEMLEGLGFPLPPSAIGGPPAVAESCGPECPLRQRRPP